MNQLISLNMVEQQSLLFMKQLIESKTTASDPIGLGRWSWMLFEGKNNHITRIISAYVPCKSTQDRYQTVYNQHK